MNVRESMVCFLPNELFGSRKVLKVPFGVYIILLTAEVKWSKCRIVLL